DPAAAALAPSHDAGIVVGVGSEGPIVDGIQLRNRPGKGAGGLVLLERANRLVHVVPPAEMCPLRSNIGNFDDLGFAELPLDSETVALQVSGRPGERCARVGA